jgi:glucosamine--fructose-6-phosphate aminotransferase (isomerizing)
VDTVLTDIMSEPSVIERTLNENERRMPGLVSQFQSRQFNPVYAFGAGSSYFVGLSGRYAIEEWARIPTIALSATDFQAYSLPAAGTQCVGLAISQSGETIETLNAAEATKEHGIHLIALTNTERSRIGSLSDQVILLQAGHEEGPGTKTVVAQCVAIYQFALHLAMSLDPGKAETAAAALGELRTAPGAVRQMLSDPIRTDLGELAKALAGVDVLYLIGAGPFWPLALQAANFLREVGRIHCCPLEATEFRHGPLEALSAQSHLLVLSNGRCRSQEQVVRACNGAMKAGAGIVYMGDGEGMPDVAFSAKVLLPPLSELLAAQVYLSAVQYLGYSIAMRKGLDPSQFSNIVKTWAE